MNDFVAIGNEELGDSVKKGDTVVNGELLGNVTYAWDSSGNESDLLGFVTIDEDDWVVSIGGKLVFGWKKV